jgi:hypothetical protein
MSRPGLVLGRRIGPFPHRLDRSLLQAFAQATVEPLAQVRAGHTVAPMAIVSQLWDAQQQGRTALIRPEVQAAATGGLHGEHDVVIHRPIVPGEPLSTWVEGSGARAAGRNSLMTLRYTTLDAENEVVVEQWWTTVWLGVTCEDAGDEPPGHSFPDGARDHALGVWQVEVDTEMARGYARVSNDWSPPSLRRDGGAPEWRR